MVVLLLALLILIVSFVSAYLSMKDFRDFPQKEHGYSLFLLRNISYFTPQFLDQLHSKMLPHETIISFERLFRGEESALVIYGPRTLLEQYSEELSLLELEDYHEKLKSKDIFSWELALKTGTKKIESPQIRKVYLKKDEQVLFQLVLQPLKNTKTFQVTGRVGVSSESISRRGDLAKDIDKLLEKSSLKKKKTGRKTIEVYRDFKERALVPKEVSKSQLLSEDLITLLL